MFYEAPADISVAPFIFDPDVHNQEMKHVLFFMASTLQP